MDKEDNDSGILTGQQLQSRLISWIFLPLPLAIMAIGFGILTGLAFKENLLLQGTTRLVAGLALTLYGLIRSVMIVNKLRGKRKNPWIEKS